MDAQNMTKKQLQELEFFKPTQEFNTIVIVPNGQIHDSGYECMEFILCDGTEIVGKVGGGSDVIHINGINGWGDLRGKEIPQLVKPIGWSIDCLPKSHLLRIFSPLEKLKLDSFIGSDFQFFVDEE